MSEWIDVVVYAAFSIAIWSGLPAWSARIALPAVAGRNPEWAAQHPAAARQLAPGRWFRWSCWLWGAASIAAVLALATGPGPAWPASLDRAPRWEVLKDLTSLLLIAGVLPVAGGALLFARRLRATVPLAERRHASLERRSIDDHVPRAVQVGVYALIGLHLASWIALGLSGRYASSAFWGGLLFQFAISGIGAWLVPRTVQRRPGMSDRLFGPRYRRLEVRVVFVAQLLPLANGLARLSEHATGTRSGDLDRFLHLGVVLLVTALIAGSARRLRRTAGPGAPSQWPDSATLAGVAGFVALIAMTPAAAHEPAPLAGAAGQAATTAIDWHGATPRVN
jgi:hypothetical protein